MAYLFALFLNKDILLTEMSAKSAVKSLTIGVCFSVRD